MLKTIAIAGIHTGIGKTIASAVIAEALGADYWKPVQAGIEERDLEQLAQLLTNGPSRVHPEAVLLTQPMSPHAAAIIDGVEIDYTKFKWPETAKTLVVETAGGLLSPMSGTTTMADFISHYQLPVILVTQNYLGSINHTLMTIEVLKNRGITLLGLIINGAENKSSESFIDSYAGIRVLGRIPFFKTIDQEAVIKCAGELKQALLNELYAKESNN
jgi:dethiobiotin synthetase